jgi:hypothetical protein
MPSFEEWLENSMIGPYYRAKNWKQRIVQFSLVALLIAVCILLGGAPDADAQTGQQSSLPYVVDTHSSSFLSGYTYLTVADTGQTAAYTSTNYFKAVGTTLIFQVDGCSTVAVQLQRSAFNPAVSSPAASWVPVGASITAVGDTTVTEPGIGWYRWVASTVTGTCNFSLSGAAYK